MRLLLLATLVSVMSGAGCSAALAAMGEPLDRTGFQRTFAAEFNEPAGTPLDKHVWRTDYYFAPRAKDGRPPSQGMAFMGRTISGEREVYVDEDYCGHSPFSIGGGTLTITATAADPVAFQTCGRGWKPYLSGLITTQESFSQTYGYFEMRAKLPTAQGTWAAFWMIPTQKTKQNSGRLPELDIVEHWGGKLVLMSGGKPFIIDRTGKPITTLHDGVTGAEQAFTNQKTAPTIDVSEFHKYGLLWTPDQLVWYVDDREIFRTPFVNADPHYMIVNLAIDGRYQDPGPFPASMIIDYVRAYQIPEAASRTDR